MYESEKERLDTSQSNSARLLTSLIGPSVIVRGTITDAKDTLTIKGTVEGTVDHEETLLIDEQGSINAEINAREVVVHGRVTGNIHGKERVRIEATGRVAGDIFAKRFSVEEGAIMKGRVVMSTTSAADQQPPSQRATEETAKGPQAVVNITDKQAPSAVKAGTAPNKSKPS